MVIMFLRKTLRNEKKVAKINFLKSTITIIKHREVSQQKKQKLGLNFKTSKSQKVFSKSNGKNYFKIVL